MLKKLRIRFVCINMTIVTVMLAALFCALFTSTAYNLKTESNRRMQSALSRSRHGSKQIYSDNEVRLPTFVIRLGPDGKPLDTDSGWFDLSDSTEIAGIIAAVRQQPNDSGFLPDYRLRFHRSVTQDDEYLVFTDTSNEQSVLRRLMINSVWIAAATFAVFLVISIFLARWAVRPVDEAWKQQKQFIADASHELKTPLTVITTNAELLAEDRSDAPTGAILDMCRRMRDLVEHMLDLARSDGGIDRKTLAPVDLSALVLESVLPFEPVFYEKGLTLETDIADGIHVTGNEVRLQQLVGILLDNARKYTSPGGRAEVRLVRSHHGRCILTVADTGDPISEADLRNIFKRFYRVDQARSGSEQGYGLGLSIAQSIVDEHNGHIRAESRDGLNIFRVDLPVKQN